MSFNYGKKFHSGFSVLTKQMPGTYFMGPYIYSKWLTPPLTQNLIIKISYRRHTSGLEQEKAYIIKICSLFCFDRLFYWNTSCNDQCLTSNGDTRLSGTKKNKQELQRHEQCWKPLWFSALWCGRGTETGYRAITSDWLSPYSWRHLSTFPPNPEKRGTHVEMFSNGSDLKIQSAVISMV